MAKQLLHLVFGGKVMDPQGHEYTDHNDLEIVGVFPNYKTALDAWRGASQRHVDDAYTKYVIVHLHRLLDPADETPASEA